MAIQWKSAVEIRTMVKTAIRQIGKFTHSLTFKLSFYSGLIMLLALMAFSYRSISAQEKNLVDKIVQGALKDSEVVKAAIFNGMMNNDRHAVREIVQAIGRRGFEQINIYDRNRRLRYSNRDLVGGGNSAEIDPLLTDVSQNTKVRYRFSRSGRAIYMVNPLLNDRSCSSAACHMHPKSQKVLGALEIKLPLDGVKRETFKNTRDTVIFGFLLFILISSVNGLAAIFLVNRNLSRLKRDAVKMARGDFGFEGKIAGSDEIAEFSRSFEDMGRRIKERTDALDARRRYHEHLFEEVPCYMTVVSRDYRIVRTNRLFREQFGNQTGKTCFGGYKGLESKCDKCPVEKTFADGLSHQSEEVWKLNGQRVHVMVKTSPIYDDQENISEVLEMSVDVTALKRLQTELSKKQQEYRYLFENAPCYLTVVDRDFNIVQTNKLFDRDFGSNNLGNKCFKVYKKRDSKCENCPVEKTLIDGQSHNSEEVWRQNGQPTYVVVSTAPVKDYNGNIFAVMEMSTNITEIKRLQEELAVLGETIAGMSHNIKNILSGLQGGVYVVDSGLMRGKQDRVEIGWQMVKSNVQKVSDLVQGILYASKERTPEYKECDPGHLLTEICDLYAGKAEKADVSLIREFDKEMGLFLLDPVGIHSAISNLVANALDACNNTSNVAPRRITVCSRIEGPRLCIRITDTGEGIPEDVKERLFTRFYSTKGAKGTGLGLVITRKVVEEHGGAISVESQPGCGTTFRVEIPLKMVQAREFLNISISPEISDQTITREEQSMNGIGLCATFSKQGDWAFDYALSLARKHRTKLNIFHFLESPYTIRRDVVFVDAQKEKTAVVSPGLIAEKDKELRLKYDQRLGDYVNVGFRLCEGSDEWELKKCFKRGEYEVLVIGYQAEGADFGGTTTIEEFARRIHCPLVLVGPQSADIFYVNEKAKKLLDQLDIPEGNWHLLNGSK